MISLTNNESQVKRLKEKTLHRAMRNNSNGKSK